MIDSGILRRHSLVTYYFRLFEKINYAVADVIGVMSPMNLKWFKINFKLDKNIEVLYNLSSATPVEKCIHSKYRKALGLQGKVVYFYGGNLGYAQDMLNLVRLAKNMEEISEAHFVFVGSGDEFKLVQKSIKNLSLTNVSLLPSVSQLEYKKMLTEFDIGLFTLHKNHKTHNFPGKILGYMESELPILGSVNPGNDLKDIIEKNEAGCILTNGDDVALVDAAKKFLNKEYRSYIGKNARNLLKNEFSVSVAATKILSLVQHG
jgi:glycosyltransferase involved in cell wall biosynthesis